MPACLPLLPFSPVRKSLQRMKIQPSQRLLCSASALLLPWVTSLVQNIIYSGMCCGHKGGREGGRERDDRLVVNPACAGRTMFSPYTDSLFLVHLRRASIQYLFFRCVEYNVACFCNFALLEVILHYPNSNKTMCMTCLDVFGVSKYL